MAENFLIELFIPQSGDAIEICRCLYTWYFGFILVNSVNKHTAEVENYGFSFFGYLTFMLSALFGFAFSVGFAANRLTAALDSTFIDNPFFAALIIALFGVLPIYIINKTSDLI